MAQAEAIIDVIRARTDKGLSAALDHLEGSLSREIRGIRDDLSGCLARIEVNIDFPGEDPDAEVTTEELGKNLSRIEKEIEKLLAGAGQGKVLREGLKTVIAAGPMWGSPALMLCFGKRAIVTDIPGTTRDVIEEMLNLGGIPVRVLDTAGIRPTRDEVERIGVERSERALKEADLVLVIMDASTGLLEEDKGVLKKAGEARCLVVVNKSDLVEKVDIEGWEKLTSRECVAVSAKTGWGLSSLEEKIRGIIEKGEKVREGPLITRVRHEEALRKALKHIREAREACSLGVPEDIIAIDVREAWTSLGEITGDTASEEIVDRIFADFCIGK